MHRPIIQRAERIDVEVNGLLSELSASVVQLDDAALWTRDVLGRRAITIVELAAQWGVKEYVVRSLSVLGHCLDLGADGCLTLRRVLESHCIAPMLLSEISTHFSVKNFQLVLPIAETVWRFRGYDRHVIVDSSWMQ